MTGGAAVGGLAIANDQGDFFCAALAALLSALAVSSPNLFRSGAIGFGDVKLAGAVGALLGTASALLTVGAATFWALAYLVAAGWLRRGRVRSPSFPFAPFLMAGFLLAAWSGFWGN